MEEQVKDTIPPRFWGVRYWGCYKQPLEFNIIVNDMVDVAKHQDVSFVSTDTVGIQSSLGDGECRVSFL